MPAGVRLGARDLNQVLRRGYSLGIVWIEGLYFSYPTVGWCGLMTCCYGACGHTLLLLPLEDSGRNHPFACMLADYRRYRRLLYCISHASRCMHARPPGVARHRRDRTEMNVSGLQRFQHLFDRTSLSFRCPPIPVN